MRKLIVFITSQFFLFQVSISQETDHIRTLANKIWLDYNDVKKQKEELEKALKDNYAAISRMEEKEQGNEDQIKLLNKGQDELKKRLKRKQMEYQDKCKEINNLKDSISVMKNKDDELKRIADNFLGALKEQEAYNKQLQNEKRKLENMLYFKGMDLDIAEIESSYFSDFKIGCIKRKEVRYAENSKGEIVKSCALNPMKYLSVSGTVYTSNKIDTLDGRVLVYIDDLLWDNVLCHFVASSKTESYNKFDISLEDKELNNKLKSKSILKVAFVTEECYSRNKEKLKNFNDAYHANPALFVISSKKPDVSRLLMTYDYAEQDPADSSVAEVPRKIDSCSSITQDVTIYLTTNQYSGEFVSLSINDVIIDNSIRLLPNENPKSFSYNFKLTEGVNFIKIKALASASATQNCNVWIIMHSGDMDNRIFRKLILLQKDELFGIYIRYEQKPISKKSNKASLYSFYTINNQKLRGSVGSSTNNYRP